MLLLAACGDNYVSNIPNYQVNLRLDLVSTYPTFKNSANEYLLFENRIFETDRIGFAGVLVYSSISLDESGNTQYFAFDMACPYEVDKDVKVYPVKIDSVNYDLGRVKCEKCGSVFNIAYGYGLPESGPAKKALKQYHTSLSGNYLYIYP